MNLCPPGLSDLRLPAALHRYLLYLIVATLVVVLFSGCSTFGIATEEYVETRVEDLNEARVDTAAAIVEPLEVIVPGITEYARAKAEGVVVRPPPPPAPTDWGAIALAVLGSIGLGAPISVGVTNHMRDKRRRALNEATNVREAQAQGYFDPVPPKTA